MNKEELKKFMEQMHIEAEARKLRHSKMSEDEIKEESLQLAKQRELDFWKNLENKCEDIKSGKLCGFAKFKCFEKTTGDFREFLNSQKQFISLQDYYPIISNIEGISTPKTQFVSIDDAVIFYQCITLGFETKCTNEIKSYIENKVNNANIIFPCFFKLATRSLKHALYGECMIFQTKEDFISKIPEIIYGMAANYDNDRYVSNTFCFRELLDIDYSVNNYGQMPLINEYRTFIKDGKITAFMPYYSYESFAQNFLKYGEKRPEKHEECRIAYDKIVKLTESDKKEIERISFEISKVMPAHHSLDIMQDLHGKWWIVDMQPAEMSFGYDKTQK